jgi:hypothetical protein
MNSMRSLTAAAMLAGLAGSASAQMVVDADLGTLPGGSVTNIAAAGDDGSAAGVAEAYNAIFDGAGTLYRTYLTQEHVYQFTITEDSTITLTNNLSDIAADRDYCLADGLTVSLQTLDTGDYFVADGGLDWIDGDFGIPTEVFEGGPYPAGTYYLAIDEWTGADGLGIPGVGGPFDVDLIIDTYVPPSEPTVFTDLGIIGDSGSTTNIDLCGSDFDTEIGVYDAAGVLIANNDDFCSLQSGVSLGLAAGTYWAAASGYNTTFGNGWVADGAGRAAGTVAGTFGPAAVGPTATVADEVLYFKFEIETGVVMPPAATDLGDIATDADTFSIDTNGSDIDTELGLWDSAGTLLANDDDGGDGTQSLIGGLTLPVGTYYMSISGFNTTFGGLFSATTSSTATGTIIGLANTTGIGPVAIGAGEVQFYSFNVTADGGGSCTGDIADDFGVLGSDGMSSAATAWSASATSSPCSASSAPAPVAPPVARATLPTISACSAATAWSASATSSPCSASLVPARKPSIRTIGRRPGAHFERPALLSVSNCK